MRAFSNFIKEKMIVSFEGDAHFNLVTVEPFKIQGWSGTDARKAMRTKAGDRFPFGMIDFRNIPGASFEGTKSTRFYEPFLSKFVDYANPKFREVNVWLWIVGDRRAKLVYKMVQNLKPKYAVLKSHDVAAPAEGTYSTLKHKKTKIINVLCLYFVYKVELLKVPSPRRIGYQQEFVRRGEVRQLSRG